MQRDYMDEVTKKRVDSEWQTQCDREKDQARNGDKTYHQPTFSIFLSSLSMQAMIAMGKVENPLTGKTESNPEQARFLIDTLDIIREKTKNNLTAEETTLLEDYLFNLRMMYIEGRKNDR